MSALKTFFASMAGRIFLILLVGGIVSASLALALSDAKRRADLDRLRLERAADQVQGFVSVIEGASEPSRAMLEQRGAPGVRIAWSSAPALRTDPELTALLAARLARSVTAEQVPPAECLPPPSQRLARAEIPRSPAAIRLRPDCWRITLTLKDGAPLRLALITPPRLTGESRAFDPLYLALMALGASALALVVARMAVKSLQRLSTAARGLGHDLNWAPVAETGPSEVREAAHAFNEMQRRLQAHLAERTHMLAAITHDLQTPLTRLRLRLEKVGDAELRERLVGDLAAMQALIQEGLELARSVDTAEPAVRLDLDSLLESAVEDAADAGQKTAFAGGCGAVVRARPQALRRCIDNLIDNALKYGGSAEVSAAREGARAIVRVRDHGPGLPPDQLEAVFEPFARLEGSRSRETGGVGLGLTIARTLAEKNHGRLTLRNHPDGGLEAVLALDAA